MTGPNWTFDFCLPSFEYIYHVPQQVANAALSIPIISLRSLTPLNFSLLTNMLTETLTALLLAVTATAAPCVASNRYQWVGAGPIAGYLSVSTSRIDQSGSHVDNGAEVGS